MLVSAPLGATIGDMVGDTIVSKANELLREMVGRITVGYPLVGTEML